MLADWINIIVQGVLLGGLYALFAAGLSISFGVMRMINIAHGDMIIFASYATIVGASYLKLPMVLTVVLVTLVLSVMGYAAQRLVFNRTLGSDLLRPLLLTFGLSIVIRESLQAAFSADVRSVEEELSDLLMAQVEVRIKKRVKRHGKVEETGELAIQFGSIDALNGLIARLRG